MRNSRRQRWRNSIVLAIASTALTLALLEVGLRVYHAAETAWEDASAPPLAQRAVVPSEDPTLIYEFNRSYRSGRFSTNVYGMADRAVSQRKPPGVTRVAIVGDSISAGYTLLPREVLYPTLLASDSLETLNFAVNGYSISQSARMARTRVGEFAPDVLIAQLCLNDPRPSPSFYTPFIRSNQWFVLHFVKSRLAPYRFAATEYVEQLYDAEGWATVRAGFESLAEFQRDHAPVLAVLFPFLYEPAYTEWDFQRYHDGYRREAERAGIAWLDLYPAFQSEGVVSNDPGEPIHPDAEGHRVAARSIRAALRSQHFIDAASQSSETGSYATSSTVNRPL